MKLVLRKSKQNSLLRVTLTIFGIALNVILGFIVYKIDFPIYIDTAGTMLVAAIGGLFPGIATAVATNVLCALFNRETIYFGFINALIAIYTAWFAREKNFNLIRKLIVFAFSVGIMSGVLSAFVQWFFLGEPQIPSVIASVESFSAATGINRFISFIILNSLLSIFDKGICFAIAYLIYHFVPNDKKIRIKTSGWKQRPLSIDEIKDLDNLSNRTRNSLKVKITVKLLVGSLALTIIMSWVGISLYFDKAKEEKLGSAINLTHFVAETMDPTIINKAIENGVSTSGYFETKSFLNMIRQNSIDVDYLYVVQVRKDGFYVAFDINSDGGKDILPGQMVNFPREISSKISAMLSGEEIEPIEISDAEKWQLTVLTPIIDDSGICRGYVGADISLDYLTEYMGRFLLRVAMIMSSFFILILAFALWTSGTGLVYPINSIEKSVENCIQAGDDQAKLDEAVRHMRSLDIQTGDEIEKMYHIICDMALNQTEKIRSVRHFSDATLKMQDGLIITMADLVESRDSDTGAHIQKTSEYSRILVEGLQKKGYYPEKITEKFKSDVVRSAPLHDIGKINISDKILNKPGKLSDEEYEIMKTHASAGREIIEKAINTVKGESYLKEARNMAAYHHERWDGKGYPDGLHGEVIPLSARIMAVADVFDALTSPRVYKPAYPLDKALEIIQEGAGTQFDPKCVEVLMDNLPEIKVVLSKYNHVV